jgi:hypothetical protein
MTEDVEFRSASSLACARRKEKKISPFSIPRCDTSLRSLLLCSFQFGYIYSECVGNKGRGSGLELLCIESTAGRMHLFFARRTTTTKKKKSARQRKRKKKRDAVSPKAFKDFLSGLL